MDFLNQIDNISSNINNIQNDIFKNEKYDKDFFMKILVQELKNQNPVEPTDTKDFINQIAQFSAVEQINNMQTEVKNFVSSLSSNNKFQFVNQIGKYQKIQDEEGNVINGKVQSIKYDKDITYVKIDDKLYDVKNVVEFYNLGGD